MCREDGPGRVSTHPGPFVAVNSRWAGQILGSDNPGESVRLVVFTSALAAGCGSSNSSAPLIDTTPVVTHPVSTAIASQPAVRDVVALRTALNRGDADEALSAIYELMNRASNYKDATKGGQVLKRELPARVHRYLAAVPIARRMALQVKLHTRAGRILRSFDLSVMDSTARSYADLGREVASAKLVWGAVLHWSKASNAEITKIEGRLGAVMSQLPPTERAAILAAVREAFPTAKG